MIALNIVEMFFFVSLAMTFILILLIVYHFKQRISLIEQKNDTIFEIINNLLQKVSDLNKYQCVLSNTISNNNFMRNIPYSKSTPEVFTENIESIPIKKIIVSDHDDDSDDDDVDDDDDNDIDEVDDDVDDNDDSDDDDNDIDDEVDDDSDDDEDIKELPIHSIKIVNIELKDIIEEEIEEIEENDLEEKIPELINSQETMIQVEKIEINMENIDNDNISVSTKDNLKDYYSKMSVQELKKVVITKGLCNDSSKLKKNELLKMLESPFI